MLFDLLAPPQGPRGRGQKKFDVAHPIHVSNSHTKFGWISSNGLGGNSITDRWTDKQTDGGDYNIPFADKYCCSTTLCQICLKLGIRVLVQAQLVQEDSKQ